VEWQKDDISKLEQGKCLPEPRSEGMDRRNFLRASIGVIAGSALTMNPISALASRSNFPGAVRADPDVLLSDIWRDARSGRNFGFPYNVNNEEMIKRMLGLSSGRAYAGPVSRETQATSHLYHLMCAQTRVPRFITREIDRENYSLFSFIHGLEHYYRVDRKPVRAGEKFFEGVINAAARTNDDRDNIRSRARYMFILYDADELENEVRRLTRRFDSTRANPKNRDFRSDEYKMHSLHWNLGFGIMMGFRSRKDNVMQLHKGNSYQKLRKKFGFDTANRNLL